MVSDWQGGDISKLFPALSGKEDLSTVSYTHLDVYKRQLLEAERSMKAEFHLDI